MDNNKTLFNFELDKKGSMSFNSNGLAITFIYPFIMFAGALISIITYPMFLIILMGKGFKRGFNRVKRKTHKTDV